MVVCKNIIMAKIFKWFGFEDAGDVVAGCLLLSIAFLICCFGICLVLCELKNLIHG